MASDKQIGSVYLHIPFCQKRCHYCDFSIIAGRDELIPRFLQALTTEIDLSVQKIQLKQPLNTIYLGGGTPTQLSVEALQQLLELLHSRFQIGPDTEFTIEANPDGLSVAKLDCLANSGVNRVSLGVQTFNESSLSILGRTHSCQEAVDSIRAIQDRFQNYSIDLIYGLPGQSLSDWQKDLDQAIALAPPHISTYCLTYEKGTRFWTDQNQESHTVASEELQLEMANMTVERLKEAGWNRYEISNYSQESFESKHNTTYWTGEPFLALGPGAASFDGNVRKVNHRSSFTWMKRLEQGISPVDQEDELTSEERARELLVVGLRMLPGVSINKIESLTGINLQQQCGETLKKLENWGWIEKTADRIRLTEAGLPLADEVAVELI